MPALFLHEISGLVRRAGWRLKRSASGRWSPAAIMSIATASLYTRNIHREFIRRTTTDRQEARIAKWASLTVLCGALLFILFLPTQYAIYLQLLGGIWIIQTLPAVLLGAYTRWFNEHALLLKRLGGRHGGGDRDLAIAAHLSPNLRSCNWQACFPGYSRRSTWSRSIRWWPWCSPRSSTP